uniref:Secreted protein n=1 Tax=Panagrellus redivivus TaxID=6233 RepID=A0A7E4VCB0_PANRE
MVLLVCQLGSTTKVIAWLVLVAVPQGFRTSVHISQQLIVIKLPSLLLHQGVPMINVSPCTHAVVSMHTSRIL